MFVFDRPRRVTRLMSTNANNVLGDGHSRNPAMSLNGRFVVFESFANNLAGGDPARRRVPVSDIFLHDRDTDEDGVFDERGSIDTHARQRATRAATPLTNHSIEPSITYDGELRGVRHRRRQRQGRRELRRHRHQRARATSTSGIACGDPPTLRRLSEPSNGGRPARAPAARRCSAATATCCCSGRRPSTPAARRRPGAIVAAAGEDGKSTTGEVPSPTTDTPPPPDMPPPPPTGSTEDPATSGDGNTTGNTTEPDPGHRRGRAGSRARRDAARRRRHAVHRRPVARRRPDRRRQRSSRSRAPTSSAGQTSVLWNGVDHRLHRSSTARCCGSPRRRRRLRPAGARSAWSSTGEASNEVAVHLRRPA